MAEVMGMKENKLPERSIAEAGGAKTGNMDVAKSDILWAKH